MNESNDPISCSKLSKYKTVFDNITGRIQNTIAAPKGTELAEKLQHEIDALLSCPDHDDNSKLCRDCHFIAIMHKKTTNLIIKDCLTPTKMECLPE